MHVIMLERVANSLSLRIQFLFMEDAAGAEK